MRFGNQNPAPKHQDHALARRMLDGDRQAFEEFFEGHYPGLYRFARARLDDEDQLARDVSQATLTQAMTHLAAYRGEASLKSWLYTICRNEIAAVFRSKRRTPRLVELDGEDSEWMAVIDSLSAKIEGPEEELRRKEVALTVHQMLDRLPGHYGDVLEWKYFHGLSVKEIARRLEVGPKAAESLLTRARNAFREALQSLEPSHRPLSFSAEGIES